MSIVENRPANVLTRSDLPFRSHNGAGRAFIDHRVPASGDEGAEIVAAEADRRSSRSILVPLSSTTTHKDSKVRLIVPGDVRADQPISILSPLGRRVIGVQPGQSIDCVDYAGQDHRLTGAPDLQHGQLTLFAGSGME
jgi:hypothetical protein